MTAPAIGILLPTREQAITGSYRAGPLLEFARRCEDSAFDSVWAGDSLVARPRLDPLVVLAAAGAVTERITLGTAALTPALRNPLVGANMVTSLDHVTAGRLVLGLGSGFPLVETENEFDAVGVPFTGRVRHLDETVALWRRAWRSSEPGAPNHYHGTRVSGEELDRLPTPARQGGPPLWLAGGDTPAVLRRVARDYDGWLPFLPSAQRYGQAWQQIQELSDEYGRPADAVTPAVYATVTVHDDTARAQAELIHYVGHYYGRGLDVMTRIQAYCWGSATRCAEWLDGYLQAGARHIVLRIGSLDPYPQLDAIAEVLLPALRGRQAAPATP